MPSMNRATPWRWLLLIAAVCGLVLPARAEIAVKLGRVSDTEAILTIVGSLEGGLPDSNAHSLFLADPFLVRPGPTANNWVLDGGDLHAGSYTVNFANLAGSDLGVNPNRPPGAPGVTGVGNTLYFGNNTIVSAAIDPFQPMPTGVPFEGQLFLTLTGGSSFAPVGATGDVHWGTTLTRITFPDGSGFTQQDKGLRVGSWEMVGAQPVPEPGSAGLWVLGLGVVAIAGRRRGRRTGRG